MKYVVEDQREREMGKGKRKDTSNSETIKVMEKEEIGKGDR